MAHFGLAPSRQPGLLDFLLHSLEPTLFQLTCAEDAWYKDDKLDLLCFALRVSQEKALPSVEYEGLESWTSLAAALSQHYEALGKPLTTPVKTQEELLQGYFREQTGADGTHVVTTVVDTKEEKTEVTFEAGALTFENRFDWHTLVSLEKNGRVFKLDNMAEEFESDDVPCPEKPWQGEAFGKKRLVETPNKGKEQTSGQASSAKKRFSPSPPASAAVSDALRKRLRAKESAAARSSKD